MGITLECDSLRLLDARLGVWAPLGGRFRRMPGPVSWCCHELPCLCSCLRPDCKGTYIQAFTSEMGAQTLISAFRIDSLAPQASPFPVDSLFVPDLLGACFIFPFWGFQAMCRLPAPSPFLSPDPPNSDRAVLAITLVLCWAVWMFGGSPGFLGFLLPFRSCQPFFS